ncbi:amino acid ABC transporter substrate-binding protein [Paenibacillus sp. GCM10012307]|uniref:Amino acid ABC transporter substrate-binding protein n=1 Tax=Paenibacillus roseus TaxID=2798579 RepID=A0A934MKS8_9BACL|nr:amino acid ABC transporter substrate-binding protein [Paenibacillus roseus]MBJ6361390.1 amino acid ABC transporter substrate-binding protein [Paenibacillus roseus]
MRKNYVVLLLLLSISIALAACGNNDKAQNQSGQGAETEQTLLDKIKKNGVIRIGTEGTYAPFTFHDKDDKLTGFDVELAREVAKRLGLKAEFIETKWDGMFAGLDAKRFDIVANQVSIRDDRKEKYDFSDPYIVSKAVLIVHQDNEEIKKLADLAGKKAGQSLTSNLLDIAKSNGAEIVPTDSFNQAIDLLIAKRTDATVNDGLSFLDFKKQQPDAPIKVVDEADKASESGFLFNKGNPELVEVVNKALAEIKADGTYLKISEAYFGADVSK